MLNPENSLSNVVISMDQRQVKAGHCFMFRNLHSCNFSDFDAFGCQNFSSGKYYWEVDVSEKTAWILGVCRKTNNHFGKNSSGFVFTSNVNHYSKLHFDPNVNHYSKYRPENGYWVVGLRNKSEYMAFEDASTSNPKVLTLFMAVPPRRVGVFLDYEAGIVSFFNVTNHGSLIYKFSRCQFSQTAYPYFNPWNCLAPMTLCQPNSWNFSFLYSLLVMSLALVSSPAPELISILRTSLPCCLHSLELLLTFGIYSVSGLS